MKKVVVHTDGACRGNPGPGAWAAVLSYGERTLELSGAEPQTTNNRMELQAAIAALQALRQPCEVEIFTDSRYVQDGVSKWIHGWKKNGWVTSTKQPVKNADLWRTLDAARSAHRVRWRWVKGHAGNALNERCDALANAAIDQLRQRSNSRASGTGLAAVRPTPGNNLEL